MRLRLIGGLAGVVALASIAASAASAATPAKVLASILAAGHAQRSVHYTAVADYGDVKLKFVGDARVDEGIQTITYTKSGQTGTITVIVTANTVYAKGDAFTLMNFVGFTKNAAANYAGRWVMWPHTDKGFPIISAGVTLSSVVDELILKGTPSKVPNTKVDGQRVLGVKATGKSSGGVVTNTVYARADGSPLPVKQVISGGGQTLSTSFTAWNQHVDVAAPKGSTPISVVRKSAPGLIA